MQKKSKLNSIRVWVAAAVCLSALLPPAGAGAGRSCSAVCYDRYYNCIVSGRGQSYCQYQYQLCLANCGTTP